MRVETCVGIRSVAATRHVGRRMGAAAVVLLFLDIAAAYAASAGAPSIDELRKLSIEELANVEVTSVFKRPEPVGRTPASIYVITREDIRRSGSVTLPEILRLAPNLTVAQRNARDYAISARGFNWYELSNKLLVLVDGRSIYTPLHAGVLWDEQQLLVEDIERIEVISGPAGTLWGANAVNGVINVITRRAQDTRGGLVAGDVGNRTRRGALRYGGKLGETGAWRAYGLGFDMGESRRSDGSGRDDDWRGRQGGFRTDWRAHANDFTLQGDLYENTIEGGITNSGGNLLGRWTHRFDTASSLTVQTYYNAANRKVDGRVSESLDTFDIEARHNLVIGDRHELVWGGGYRRNRELFDNDVPPFVLVPEEDVIQIANLFAQDSFALLRDLTLTFGIKFEYSSYTGTEILPSVRVAWQVAESHMLWGAVSRAVRTPSRIDRELEAPGIVEGAGDNFGTESLIAYELGYRGRPDDRSSVSFTLYYHDYDDLRVLTVSPSTGLFRFGNAQKGYTTGIEAWGDYRLTDRWRIAAGVNLMRKSLELQPGTTTAALVQHQGNDPEYQLFLRSYFNVTDDVTFDASLRRVGRLPSPAIPDYTALDLRLGWQVNERIELSLTGKNLLDSQHPETGTAAERGEIPRSVLVGARLRF